MSMIGLFTAAPQPLGTKAPTTDVAAAEGFGSMLQGAVDALAQDPAGAEADAALAETPAGEAAPASTSSASGAAPVQPSLVELAEAPDPTGTGVPLVELVDTPAAEDALPLADLVETPAAEAALPLVELVGTPDSTGTDVPLVELVETPTGDAVPVSTGSGGGVAPVGAASPLVELVEIPPGDAVPASTGSASGPVRGALPQVEPVETSTSIPVPVSTGSAGAVAPVGAGSPLVELVETPTANRIPASTGSASGASLVEAVETRASTSSASGVSPASTTAPAVAPVPVAPTPTVAPTAPVAAPVPAAPLATQLARPIFSLVAAGAGEHVMTVSVTPDNLGPVTVRAHVGPEGVRVELFAPNDLGRDAIRTIIPDLRRDLAGAGLGGNLTLSSQNQPSSDGSPQGALTGQQGERDNGRGTSPRASAADLGDAPPPEPRRASLFGTNSTIDVLA